MKRATINCKLEYYFEGKEEGLDFNDPIAVWLMLPDNDLYKLTGDVENDIRAAIWVSGGFLHGAEIVKVDSIEE